MTEASVSVQVAEARSTASAERLAALGIARSPQIRRHVATNPHTPTAVIAMLSQDRDWRTRAIVAARTDVPASVADNLVADHVWQVRFALAKNRSSDLSVLEAVTRAPDTDIRLFLAQNTWKPESIALALASDKSKEVRQNLAVQTGHTAVLDLLLHDEHQDVRADALRNQLISPAHLAAAAHDGHRVVRAGAAHHPDLPEPERLRLSRDRSRHVRDAAADPFAREFYTAEDEEPSAATDLETFATWPATPRKPTTRWFKIFSAYRPSSDWIPDHVSWFWRYGVRIDRDDAWATWWEATALHTLNVSLSVAPQAFTRIEERGQALAASTTCPELWELISEAEDPEQSEFDQLPPDVNEQVISALLLVLKRLLDEVQHHLGLEECPPLPPRP